MINTPASSSLDVFACLFSNHTFGVPRDRWMIYLSFRSFPCTRNIHPHVFVHTLAMHARYSRHSARNLSANIVKLCNARGQHFQAAQIWQRRSSYEYLYAELKGNMHTLEEYLYLPTMRGFLYIESKHKHFEKKKLKYSFTAVFQCLFLINFEWIFYITLLAWKHIFE